MKQRPDINQAKKRNVYSGKEAPVTQHTSTQPPSPVPVPALARATWRASWFLLPLRLFLGITFVYAGIQKLTDPQYFNPKAPGYIGKQMTGFASGSPLHGFLMQFVVPHAQFFGALVAYGEIAIGIGALIGLLLRPAAFFGLLLSVIFFLTASWHVFPYFYGADIVFIFCWLTLLLAGPLHSGLPALDAFLVPRFLQSLSQEWRLALAQPLHILTGVGDSTATVSQPQNQQWLARPTTQRGKFAAARQAQESRRNFLVGLLTGGAAMLGLTVIGSRLLGRRGDEGGVATSPAGSSASSSATAGSTPGGNTIARVSAVPNNSAVTFTIPSNGDPGILVHLNNGQFVAYDATCTHAGCPVDYDSSQQLLVCPCHGAAFDPAKNGAVVQPPASTPLTNVTIHIDSSTGAITI